MASVGGRRRHSQLHHRVHLSVVLGVVLWIIGVVYFRNRARLRRRDLKPEGAGDRGPPSSVAIGATRHFLVFRLRSRLDEHDSG